MMHVLFRLKCFIPLMGLILILGCNSAATQEMPDLVLERINVADGTPSLANWTVRPGQRVTQAKVLTPNHSAFPEARLFYETSKGKTPQSATESVLALNGFEKSKFLAHQKTTTDFVRTIDGHKDASVNIYIYKGILNGKAAKAIAYTWSGKVLCGNEEFCSVAHVFMAPDNQFEALGGGAVLAVAWLEQDVPENVTSMKKYGNLTPRLAVEKLGQYADSWMASYIQTHVQMMQMMGSAHNINQQVLSSMQSYNNALSQCYGLDCSIVQGPGNSWSVEVD